jgi:hypothetical protein
VDPVGLHPPLREFKKLYRPSHVCRRSDLFLIFIFCVGFTDSACLLEKEKTFKMIVINFT